MTTINKHQFLLDENVDIRIRDIFLSENISCLILREVDKLGAKNGELLEFIKNKNYVLVTHDRDFEVLWKIHNLKIILLKIHPTTLKIISPRLTDFLKNYSRDLGDQFLIELSLDGILTFQ